MSVYESVSCPYCKYKLSSFQRTGINDYTNIIGEPFIKCPNCNGKIKTGADKWGNLSIIKKSLVLIMAIITIMFTSIRNTIAISLLLMAFVYFLNIKSYEPFYLIMVLALVLNIIYYSYRVYKNINSIIHA